jgi:hypothetical protein
MNDVEHAQLFTKDYDREYTTESSYEDEYETVSFIPTSQHGVGQTSLSAGSATTYKDSLLQVDDLNLEERSKARAKSNRLSSNHGRTELDGRVDDDPLRRWLGRDP